MDIFHKIIISQQIWRHQNCCYCTTLSRHMEERIFIGRKKHLIITYIFFLFHEHEQMLYLFVVLNILNLLDWCAYKFTTYQLVVHSPCKCYKYLH